MQQKTVATGRVAGPEQDPAKPHPWRPPRRMAMLGTLKWSPPDHVIQRPGAAGRCREKGGMAIPPACRRRSGSAHALAGPVDRRVRHLLDLGAGASPWVTSSPTCRRRRAAPGSPAVRQGRHHGAEVDHQPSTQATPLGPASSLERGSKPSRAKVNQRL